MYEIIGAVVGAFLTGLLTFYITRRHIESDYGQRNLALTKEVDQLKADNGRLLQLNNEQGEAIAHLTTFRVKYHSVRDRLQASAVVRIYHQPVLLVGPRNVGKTSLLRQWHAPWNHTPTEATATHQESIVPIFDFKATAVEAHFADPDILVDVHVHLRLKVHDFPGELPAQASAVAAAKNATTQLRGETAKSLGIVIVCMLDASEARGSPSAESIAYYNGELFARLRELVAHAHIGLERLILVFNKYDVLRDHVHGLDDAALMKLCIERFSGVLSPLRGICNPDRVCEVFTILRRGESMIYNNRGAPIVLGEASRRFVEVMAGSEAANNIIRGRGSNYSHPLFE